MTGDGGGAGGALDALYQATIVDHDRAPRNQGELAGATHHATLDNPLCGDVVTVQARLTDGAIADIAFEARGCALSRAAASIMTTMVRGRSIADVQQLAAAFEHCVKAAPDAAIPDELGELRAFAGVRRFRSRRLCALLPFRALLEALGGDT
jgi:nitrogen fixation NifU-like protein